MSTDFDSCTMFAIAVGDQGAWTTLTPTGGIHTPGSMRLPPDAPRGTVIVQLVSGTHPLATGTVQVAELQRVAAECDALATDAPHHSSRFLSNLVPSSWRRWEQGSTMLWVRMVDGNGAEAGHVVLSAKVVPGEAFLHGGLNNHAASVAPMSSPSGEPSAAGSPAPSATIERAATPIPMPPPPPPLSKEATHRPPSAASPAAVPRPYQQPPPAFDQIMRASVQGGPLTRTQTAGGFLQAKAQHVYDVLLDSALAAAGCGPAALLLQGPWAWLAGQFAQRYNVRQQYVTLAHLTWVVRPGIAAPTATCFRTLVSELAPLIAERERLISAELALLTHVLERVNALLTTCFEAYFALNEDSKGGLADGVLSVRSPGTPPALAPAVALLELTRGDLTGSEGVTAWLTARLRTAARKRFQGLLAATEARRGVVNESRIGLKNAAKEDEAALWAYLRMEELCTGIMNELRADDVIQASGAMPTSVRLPEVTAVEYVRGCTAHLQRTLQRHPPPAPTPPAVQLVEAVGRLQSFVERHGYAEALARLSSKEIFGGFVQEWVAGSAVSLRRTLRALDHAGPPALIAWADLRAGPSNRVAPLVEGMLMDVEKEMQLYERIVGHWPVHAMELEAALVAVLREATSAASRQCGLVQTKEEHPAIGAENGASQGGGAQRTPRGGRVAWRWVAVGAAPANAANDVPQPLRKGINPYQALLLNSLRRLLALVPQLEHTLTGWCGGAAALPQESLAVFPPPSAGAARVAQEAPDLGAHWAQLVKELRTEYYACITLCAESLAGELAASSATSLAGLLRREALTTAPASVGKHARRVLENTATTLRCLAAGLDGRVFVALGRGLWDLAARDVLRYAEDLSEGGTSGAWRGRQSAGVAMRALDTFYRAELAAAMGSDLHNRDLMPPQHAQRAAALLADNSADINNSFDVY